MRHLKTLHLANRPLIAFGAGVRDAAPAAIELANQLRIPVVVTWGARDLFPQAIGAFGTHGVKAANIAVQNCDWLLTVGTRLDTKSTGWPPNLFAPSAAKYVVDIDPAELGKFAMLGLQVEGICCEAGAFLDAMLDNVMGVLQHEGSFPDWREWWDECYANAASMQPGPGRPYEIMGELSRHLTPDDTVVSDTGCVIAWAMQALSIPKDCRFIHAWNMTPMGYGLPAAVGAAFATGRRVILLTGDGGLSVNITEMATVAKHKLNIKILLFNNRGHAMCRQTQRVWLDGKYAATGEDDLATPNFGAVAEAYEIPSLFTISGFDEKAITYWMNSPGPAFLEFPIDYDQGVSPQVKFGEALA